MISADRRLGVLVLAVGLAWAQPLLASEKPVSLRGAEITASEPAVEHYRYDRDRAPWSRDYPQQVPRIPHGIKGYALTRHFNKCLDCHAWQRHADSGAPRVALSHYLDREGRRLPGLAARYYFCVQCHVPQTDARDLVPNLYRPPEADALNQSSIPLKETKPTLRRAPAAARDHTRWEGRP